MTNNNNYLISYRTLRQLIGVLGILLPFLCWGVNSFVNELDLLNNPAFINADYPTHYQAAANLKSSISHFYYTAAGPLFTGILITVAIFLFCYNGYPQSKNDDKWYWLTDNRISDFAAICALGIVTFPTGAATGLSDNIHIYISSNKVGHVHLIFASLFFLAMALMSIVNFRRRPGKQFLRNAEGRLYLTCGIGIIVCLVALGVYALAPSGASWLWGKYVFILEVVMLLFFGIAWLVKGKWIGSEIILQKLSKP